MQDIKTDAYEILHITESEVSIKGKLRLPSPSAYNPQFLPIQDAITNVKRKYFIDISELEYLNSSGINAIAKLVLHARSKEKELILKVSRKIPWQDKTIVSLSKLYGGLDFEFIG